MSETSVENEKGLLQRQYWCCAFVCAVILLNFIAFGLVASYYGGDAINGKFKNGHYYVFGTAANASGKTYTEVSKEVFNYSRLHALSVLLTWPMGIAAMYWANKIKARMGGINNSRH